jgi:hypothetical protein
MRSWRRRRRGSSSSSSSGASLRAQSKSRSCGYDRVIYLSLLACLTVGALFYRRLIGRAGDGRAEVGGAVGSRTTQLPY